jgi:hypothetical protein
MQVKQLVRDQGVGGSLSPINFFNNLQAISGVPSTRL